MMLWLGLFYVVVGIDLLIRQKAEADGTIEWVEQANWRVMFGGRPRPLPPWAARPIRIATIVAGVASLIIGLASITVFALRK